jgi:pimeloyl-ACP methyl ester carboxylesterase
MAAPGSTIGGIADESFRRDAPDRARRSVLRSQDLHEAFALDATVQTITIPPIRDSGMVLKRRRFIVATATFAGSMAFSLGGPARAQAQATFFKLIMSDGVNLTVERQGKGPSLLLVHGASGSHLSYARLIPLLTSSFTTYALDRRGYGGSDGQTPYSVRREAEDIAAVINALPAPVYVFAHSSGAVETLEALLLTNKVQRAILYEPPLTEVGDSSPVPVCSLVAAGKMEEALVTFYRDYVRLSPSVITGIQASPAWAAEVKAAPALCNELTALSAYHFDAKHFASLRTPTLFLLGDQSPPFMAKSVKSGVAAVTGARLQMLPGQQHGALVQAPEMIATIIMHDFASA